MNSNFAFLVMTALSLPAAAGCTSAPPEGSGASTSHLNAKSTALWPMSGGVATIPVCWLPAIISPDQFPNPALGAPSTADVAARQAWVREIAESQWNALTPIRFVGFAPCSAGASAEQMVQLQPIDSTFVEGGYDAGQAHAQALGKDVRGKKLFINMFFGDEKIYQRRVQGAAATGTTVDPAALPKSIWAPAACLEEMKQLTSASVADPAQVDAFMAVFKSCLQNNVLHELGHVAGFAHEQYRPDVSPACKAQLPAAQTDLAHMSPADLGDTPLGPFEAESIMSYCRTDARPLLTAEDVTMTSVVYGGGVWGPTAEDGPPGMPGTSDDTGMPGQPGWSDGSGVAPSDPADPSGTNGQNGADGNAY